MNQNNQSPPKGLSHSLISFYLHAQHVGLKYLQREEFWSSRQYSWAPAYAPSTHTPLQCRYSHLPTRADEQHAPNLEACLQTQLCHGAQGNTHAKNPQHGHFKTQFMFQHDTFFFPKHDPKKRREHIPLSLVWPSLDLSRNKGQGSPFTLK